MKYKVNLTIEDVDTGIRSETDVTVDVWLAPSGFYIAENPDVTPVISGGQSPRYAIIEWLGDMFYSTTTDKELANS